MVSAEVRPPSAESGHNGTVRSRERIASRLQAFDGTQQATATTILVRLTHELIHKRLFWG